jgi:hypothetical protein
MNQRNNKWFVYAYKNKDGTLRYLVEADYSPGDLRERSGRSGPLTVVVTKSEESITLIINTSIK